MAREKSKNVSDSSATRRSGVSEPRTDHDFIRKIGVDDIADLPNCPKKFEYGKDFLPHSFVARLSRFYEKDAHLVQKGM